MSKKIISILITIVTIAVLFSVSIFADNYFYNGKWNMHNENIKLYFCGDYIDTDVPSLIIDNRTLVPVRAFFEKTGAFVDWNETDRAVTIKNSEYTIVLYIDSYVSEVNGEKIILDVPAKIVTDEFSVGRTLVPIRFIASQLGYSVRWDEKTYSVYVDETGLQNDIISISASTKNDVDTITINTEIKSSPVVTKMANPDRLVIDFYEFVLKNGDGALNKSGVCFSNIRYANHDKYSRIVVDISNNFNYEIYTDDNKCTIVLTKKTDIPVISPQPSPTPTPTNPIEPSNRGSGLVVIDPGHGGSDPGAIGYKDGEVYLRESDVNLDISLKLFNMLKNAGINVAMTRTTDEYVGLKERAEYANNLDASLFICVHNNSATIPDANGTMVYYYTSSGDSATKEAYGITSKELASLIQKQLLKFGGRYDRKIADGSKFVVLYSTKMPAILTECAFISNDEERELLNKESFRSKLAEGIYHGVIDALKQMDLY